MTSANSTTLPYHVPSQSGTNLIEADVARENLFNKILDQLAASSLFSNSTRAPNIFIVYAHDNLKEGTAYDGCVRDIIKWLGKIHARILSDQSPLPPLQRRLEGDDAIRNILANQLCLLPPKPDSAGIPTATSVDNVIVCGSEVLERYYSRPSALSYIRDIVHICNTGVDQSTSELMSTIRAHVGTETKKDDFHHVFTELAFLEVRKSVLPEANGMVPVVLSQANPDEAPMRYLPMFYDTDVKLKLKSPEPRSLHKLFFKLLEQLFPDDRDFIRPFRECYDSVTWTLALDRGTPVTQAWFDDIVNPGITKAYQKFWALFCVVLRDGKLQAYAGELSDQVSQVLTAMDLSTRHNILQWLSPISAPELHGRFHDAGTNRMQGTCDWVIQNGDFQQWHASKGSALIFLCGSMGAGKTYSTSRVVDWVQQGLSTNTNDEAFAYFYCNKQDSARRRPKEILRNIIRQLATGPWKSSGKGETIHKTVHDLWMKSRDRGISSTFAQWEECLLALIDTYPRTTIVLDAFDECEQEQRQDLLKVLIALAGRHQHANQVKIFISTRPEEDVLQKFDQYPVIRVKDKHNSGDIATFVRTKIAEHSRWSKMPEIFQTEVIKVLLEKCGDMFLFASLQIQHLLLCRTQPALKNRLKKLPDSLEKTYQEIYENATSDADERELLERALKWVMCSAKPLNTDELLLAICQDSESDGVMEGRQDVDEELILALSQNLLSLEEGIDDYPRYRERLPVWRLAHQAVAEFLGKSEYCNIDLAHYDVGKVCLMVLLDTFCGNPVQSTSNLDDDVSETSESFLCPCQEYGTDVPYHGEVGNPLVEYAIWAWPTHVRAQEHREPHCVAGLSQKLQEFLGEPEEGSSAYNRWMEHACYKHLDRPRWSIFAARRMPSTLEEKLNMNPISLACYLGFYNTLAEWWNQPRFDENTGHSAGEWRPWGLGFPHDLGSVHNSLRWSLVALACAHDEAEIMNRLLDRGAHFNTIEDDEVPPIVVAAMGGSVDSVKELLRRGSEIHSSFTRKYGNVLTFAIRRDSLEVIQLLLSQFLTEPADLEKTIKESYRRFKSEEAITLFVDKGVNVNTPLRDRTLLAHAAYEGWEKLVHRLLDEGADVNVQFDGYDFHNALEASVISARRNLRSSSITYLLLEHGAHSTLQAIGLSCRGWIDDEEVLQLLFKESIDLNETWRNDRGQNFSVLVDAVERGNVRSVRCLIQHGADVNLKVGGRYRNALNTLFLAALDGDEYPTAAMLEVLEEAGANLETLKGYRLNTALAAVAFSGLEEKVQHLLDLGASPNAFHAHDYTTALGAAAASEHARASQIIQMLLDGGADVNAYFPEYCTYKVALDWPARSLLDFSMTPRGPIEHKRMQNWLQSARVLLSNGAIWDIHFTKWRECLELMAPDFARRNSQSLDQMLQMLQRNRANFFLTNPGAASDEKWQIKEGGHPSWHTRSILDAIMAIEDWK